MPRTITSPNGRSANRRHASSNMLSGSKKGDASVPISSDRVRSRLVIPSGLESSEVVINGKPKSIEVALSVQTGK